MFINIYVPHRIKYHVNTALAVIVEVKTGDSNIF